MDKKEEILLRSQSASQHETTLQLQENKKQAMSLHLELIEQEI
jgi:hypothetical protein